MLGEGESQPEGAGEECAGRSHGECAHTFDADGGAGRATLTLSLSLTLTLSLSLTLTLTRRERSELRVQAWLGGRRLRLDGV